MTRQEREEDDIPESFIDDPDSANGMVAGAVLLCLFGAQQVRNAVRKRRKRRQSTERIESTSDGTCCCTRKLELQECSFSMSDVDSHSDFRVEHDFIPSSPVTVSGLKRHMLASECSECSDGSDRASCNGLDGVPNRDIAAVRRVKSMVYQRVFVDERNRDTYLAESERCTALYDKMQERVSDSEVPTFLRKGLAELL